MQIVISPERAVAEGVSPQSLIAVAEWHDGRATIVERALGAKKKRAFGGPVSHHDQTRHERLAAEIRQVAAAVARLTILPVAA